MRQLSIPLIALALLWTPLAIAMTRLEQLVAQGDVRLSVDIVPKGQVVPGQRIQVMIVVETATWFTGGTDIRVPEVPDLVLIQNQQFAVNSTERRGQRTWTQQRWTLDAAALRPGRFTIDPIVLDTHIAASSAETVQGTLSTPPLSIEVTLPEALAEHEGWVASPALSINIETSPEGPVRVGDAISRLITVRAEDVLAMQLPTPPTVQISGLQHYPDPPVLRNRHNRGAMSSERRDHVTYIAERPGTHRLPGYTVIWWDTRSQSLRELRVAPWDVEVVSADSSPPRPKSRGLDALKQPEHLIWIALTFMGLAVIGLLAKTLNPRVTRALSEFKHRLKQKWAQFRRPALAPCLNPENSAAVQKAEAPPQLPQRSREHPH